MNVCINMVSHADISTAISYIYLEEHVDIYMLMQPNLQKRVALPC
jgi:hypothetical protein